MKSMKLYVFDSCPFCVRVRALVGLKRIDCELVYLVAGALPEQLSDRVERFSVPILEVPGIGGDQSSIMQESDVILRYLDQLDVRPALDRYTVNDATNRWLKQISPLLDPLCYPRMRLLELPELASAQARAFFEDSVPS